MDLSSLIGRLNAPCRAALERAAQRSLQQTQYHVEIEHLMLELLAIDGGDLSRLLPPLGIPATALAAEMHAGHQRFERGSTYTPALAKPVINWLQLAAERANGQIRAGLLLLVLIDSALRQHLSGGVLLAIPVDTLRGHWRDWAAESIEAADDAPLDTPPPAPTPPVADSALEQYTQDLTADARNGQIDPIIGRDQEIRQCIDILLRRRQNNPILVGEPGVGKTAIVEGLALRIASGDVPPPLRNVSVRTLDLGQLQAGAGIKGEFELRLKRVIDAVQRATNVILFIDEAHTLIGAGAGEGQSDAANLLKPALARGLLRTVAATTWIEYKKYFERDAALARRFQLIRIDEPTETVATEMLRAVATRLEQHHDVRVLDAAIRDAVRLSHRYLSSRQLPDKAISVLDTACARVALAQYDVPERIEVLQRALASIHTELTRLQREQASGHEHTARILQLEAESAAHQTQLAQLETRWRHELAAVRELLLVRGAFEALADEARELGDAVPPELDLQLETTAAELARLEQGLCIIRDGEPMVPEHVDVRDVAAVIADWTGVPVGRMLADEAHAIRTLAQRMGQRVLGQEAALNAIAQRIQAWRAGLTDPQKPVGVFLLVGPSGVGKTETAYALADALYGGERNLITVNLAEYQEAHSVSQLRGAPPGYVGHGSGGILTEAVRRKPFSVVLLDEIEKAHPDVLEAFYNVFDKGVMEDGTGLVVDFRNTVILATSAAGTELIADCSAGEMTESRFGQRLREALAGNFRAALLARLTVVGYSLLDDITLGSIVETRLRNLRQRYADSTGKHFDFDHRIVTAIVARCRNAGARDVDNVLMAEVVGKLADWMTE
ncbi:type VI secretion system ATPase TssH [Jeongeupia naejangsanensis]|uniref:Type VI secretion system ATPase TssH n=1 Tax=Jeongeupia naejangsanensis TaxID=613195 RepID=A0ABS2BL59_9NEIS|nr:type VI secretion system ATPase TssH [Jeongeupia naejangsanensis]MBM3116355.1 type VI secretion system ATPase TssH [Jeongeupia naejangsanensis]